MCGIAGRFGALWFDVRRGLDAIEHRGPDGRGEIEADDCLHGHVRLAMVDLTDASAQPFRRGRSTISFNGEIWNHKALREELAAAGHVFSTTGDTEVLAALLDAEGIDGLARVEGMFAFCWTRGDARWLVRDRYGKIPLYAVRRDGFAWASERRAFDKLGGIAVPVPPGAALDLNTGHLHRWYELPSRAPGPDVLAELKSGVTARLFADARVCCLVSGGMDSAAILALAREASRDVVAYTARLNDRSADLAAARRMCEEWQVPLMEVPVPPVTAAALERAALAIEIPSKAQVEIALPCLALAEAIQSDGYKGVLSGEAADELFGGYGNMAIQAAREGDAGWRRIRVAQLAKMARGNFVRCNKAFMAHGVECRLPFMERSLVEGVLAMGKRDCPPGKGLLKRSLDGTVPDWIRRRTKATFQGESGVSAMASEVVSSPTRFYNATIKTAFGRLINA